MGVTRYIYMRNEEFADIIKIADKIWEKYDHKYADKDKAISALIQQCFQLGLAVYSAVELNQMPSEATVALVRKTIDRTAI